MTKTYVDGVDQSGQDPDIDGLTATVTELNYVDGVTSAIQTQLNTKISQSRSIIGCGSGGANAISNTSGIIYIPFYGNIAGASLTESNVEQTLPIAYTIKNSKVNVKANADTVTKPLVLQKNSTATTISISITALTTGIFSDTTNSVSFASTDIINWEIAQSTTGTIVSNSILSECLV